MSQFLAEVSGDLRRRQSMEGGGAFKQLFETGFWAVLLYRIAYHLRRGPLRPLGRFVYNLNMVITGADLDPDWPSGPGLYLPHPVGVVVAGTLGSNVTLFNGCTIGGIGKLDPAEGLPILGADCVIFSGARVLGPIVLGRGTRVGANAVLMKSTPPDALAVGVPARIRRRPRIIDAALRNAGPAAGIGAAL